MNCETCKNRVTGNGCLCSATGIYMDLLRKLERSNDAWIEAQIEIAELKKLLPAVERRRKTK